MIRGNATMHSPNLRPPARDYHNGEDIAQSNDGSEISMPRENLSLSREAQEMQDSPDGPSVEHMKPSLLSMLDNITAPETENDPRPQKAATSTLSPVSNFLSMLMGGTVGLNGVTAGQSTWPGGGNIQSTEGYEDMIDSFSQGDKGNCASVATIKAAMDTYGDDVFENVTENPDGSCQVTMKDGVTVDISSREMKPAEKMADFEGMEGEELDEAVLCYASMAKRAQMEQNDGFAREHVFWQ